MSQGIPLTQCKMHFKKSDLLSNEVIELCKQDENGEPLLPTSVPKFLPYFEYVKDHEKVI